MRHSGLEITYNRDIFPPDMEKLQRRAAAVACLFENIILPARAVELPDIETYTRGGTYLHPDLRLQMSFDAPDQFAQFHGWMDFGNDDGEPFTPWDHLEGIASELQTRAPVKAFFRRYKAQFPGIAYLDFTVNAIVAVNMARKHNAVLFGNGVFQEFYQLLRTEAPAEMDLFPVVKDVSPRLPLFAWEDLGVRSLDFNPGTIDNFAAIRMDKDIRKYGENWRKIIATSPRECLQDDLRAEMARAYELSNIAKRTCGVFSFLGSLLTWVGLAPMEPVVSTAAAMGGAAADFGVHVAQFGEKRFNWYMVGAKMESVATDSETKAYRARKRRD